MELVYINNALVLERLPPDRYTFSPFRIMVKLPTPIYQVYYDMAVMTHDKELAKHRIRQDLFGWIKDKYPSYGVIAIQDFSSTEAKELSERTKHHFDWGMYIVLELDAKSTFGTDVMGMLPEPQKQIEDGSGESSGGSSEVPKELPG